jgi:hypothetical protein
MSKTDRPAVDRIMYCHGFASNFDPQKDKVKALSMLAPVQGVTVDYTSFPEKVFEAFAAKLQEPSRTLIVGTSMGRFFAAWRGSVFNLLHSQGSHFAKFRGWHFVARELEQVGDWIVNGDKSLQLGWRFELLHGPLFLPGRLMRVLRSIVQTFCAIDVQRRA